MVGTALEGLKKGSVAAVQNTERKTVPSEEAGEAGKGKPAYAGASASS